MRVLTTILMFVLSVATVSGQEKTEKPKPSPADEVIRSAIDQMDAQLEKIDDMAARQKLMKAIEQLESVLYEDGKNSDASPDFEVKPLVLKKKFQGKAAYDAKTGQLSLFYDFTKKEQLKDFDLNDAKVAITNKALLVDGGDTVNHIAKFKVFTVSGIFGLKSMRSCGIGSTNGSHLGTGGLGHDTLYMGIPGGAGDQKIVPDKLRSGSIPFSLSVTPRKTSISYGTERLTQATVKKDDIHQIVVIGGTEGIGIANLTIVGIPDPKWFKEFLESN